MYEEYLNAIRKENLLEHVHKITGIAPERLSGSAEEKRIIGYFKEVLERDRIPVTVHEIDAYVSFPRESKLEVFSPDSRTHPLHRFRADPVHRGRRDRGGGGLCGAGRPR